MFISGWDGVFNRANMGGLFTGILLPANCEGVMAYVNFFSLSPVGKGNASLKAYNSL